MKRMIAAAADDRSVERMRDDMDIALSIMMDNATFLSEHIGQIPDPQLGHVLKSIEEFNDTVSAISLLENLIRKRTVAR